MKHLYKLLVPILVLCILCAGCSKEPNEIEYGTITEIDLSTGDEEEQVDENVFHKMDNTFGYVFRKVRHERAYMEFEIPNHWTERFYNARHLTVQAPSDDPTLPDLTIQILACYTLDGLYHDTVGSYGEIFSDELNLLPYTIDGRDYRLTGYNPTTYQDTDTSFTDRADMVSLAIFEDVGVIGVSSGRSPGIPCTCLQYYVDWAGIPMVFSTICEEEMAESAEELLRYMVSSITYEEVTESAMQTVSYDGITFTVPTAFEMTENENIYLATEKKSTAFSGMGAGVFRFDEKLSEENLMFTYGDLIARKFLPVGDYVNVYTCLPAETRPKKIGGETAEVYTVSCTVNPKEEKPGDFYTIGQTWYMTVFALPDVEGGINRAVCLWSQDSQYRLRDRLEEALFGV